MQTILYLAKLGELTLKGKNKISFEQRLVQNTKLLLNDTNIKVRLQSGRLYIEGHDGDKEKIEFALNHLMGITGWAQSLVVEKNIEAMKEAVYSLALAAQKNGIRTYKVEARRSDKKFPLTSYEIASSMGEKIYSDNVLKVNVKKPELIIRVEVREECYIYGQETKGNRGLPVGSSGKGLLLLSGGIDSPVAGYRMIRRGMKLDCLYFHSHPYTSPEAQQKVEDLAQILANYGLGLNLIIVPFTKVQQRIRDKGPQDYTTLLLRVCMIKLANMVAKRTEAKAIITGESLGQVASQTIENLSVTNAVADVPILKPLIGLDKEEIVETAIKINTYDISILPYEDCCVLFTPKHPVLKAHIDTTLQYFDELEIEELLQEAFENRERKKINSIALTP